MTDAGDKVPDRVMRTGYRASEWLWSEMERLQRTTLWLTVLVACMDQALIIGSGVVALFAFLCLPIVAMIVVYPILGLAAARGMRGLECLVHEASHYNWTRSSRHTNDRLANVLAAWPALSEVANYRRSHFVHHAELGSDKDTDLVRWRALALADLDRTERLRFFGGLAQRIVPYLLGWWAAIGVDRTTIIRCVAWHTVALAVACLLLSSVDVIEIWILGWMVPFLLILPTVRFIGEIEEHRYDHVDTVIEATYTNIGLAQRLIFHPHGDAYHTFHHLFAAIPFYRVRGLHNRLMAENLRGYRELVTERESVCVPVAMPTPVERG